MTRDRETNDTPLHMLPQGLRGRVAELEAVLHKMTDERAVFVLHIQAEQRRNVLLQARLDDAIGREARLVADKLDDARVLAPVQSAEGANYFGASARYMAALASFGRPATVGEIAKVAGKSSSAVQQWVYHNQERCGLVKAYGPRLHAKGPPPTLYSLQTPVGLTDA